MGSCHWPLMEMSRLVKDDPQANALLDEFFDACFSSVQPFSWTPSQTATERGDKRIAQALEALNAWLRDHAPETEPLTPPAEMPLDDWAEEIALQLLTNTPC
ncbi:hypothetical protein [Trichloromonas acetexigens]|jgi:hypothetical protein|uniref:Uncharacterized protein n=1 Tax=Trichloromonas acetexigens TaxID=38815 RepID=A0A550JDB6_9BACT|nr:hypothetical protein [Desulfuromonas acetexigens]TRO81203.1 hypothetical protein FL622_09855 [Desulfuromonas acetexigens]